MIPQPRLTTPARRRLLRCLAIAWFGLGLTFVGGCKRSEAPADGEQSPVNGEQTSPKAEAPPANAEELLARTVAAYQKASSYADAGTVRRVLEPDVERWSRSAPFSLTLVRPNKMRLQMYETVVVSDGEQLHAYSEDLSGQVLEQPATAELTMASIYNQRVLPEAFRESPEVSPQLVLMLEDDPLKKLLADAEEPTLGEPGRIGDRQYYRVEAKHAGGSIVFWIDQESYVLRRMEYPTDAIRRSIEKDTKTRLEVMSMVADFQGARLGGNVPATAFQFQMPADAKPVEFFIFPDPAQLLGKKVPDFRFVDLEGNAVTPKSLAGKIAVLHFWATGWQPSLDSLPSFEQVYQEYQSNDKLTWLAVSVDPSDVEDKTLQEAFQKSGQRMPIFRDPEYHWDSLFKASGLLPLTFLIDDKGVVQDCDYDYQAKPKAELLTDALPKKLEKLLAGEDIYHEPLKVYQKELEERQRALEAVAEDKSPDGAVVEEQKIQIPRAEIAERSEPKTFKLVPLWKCADLKSPGNILAVEQADGPPRLLVIDDWKSVVELRPEGTVLATHQLDIEETEVVSNLRTASGADGKRYFAGLSFAQQRFHLFDENWKLLISHPQDALENKHAGIADVVLGDLEGDGTIKVYVGYRDVVGVKGVSLKGKLLWSNRLIPHVGQLAIGGPDAQGSRHLVCISNGSLVTADAKGQRLGTVTVPGRFLLGILPADLDGDGRPEWCGLAVQQNGDHVAIGLNLKGEELWHYALPPGAHRQLIELIVAGKLLPDAPGQWLLPAADGSIHLVAAGGKPLDRFNYGAELTGLATTELDGKPVLIVSSSNGLEAWKVE